ncbi:hypothetical protein [Colwellia sp. Bg11-12]|uniref:hypothetical protein n=1 Tax=Colwellia sp. Bg11-12 TaxID=2759817 RepID=UPI0015F66B4B|nr:hypothetical protein [Colwellia sp. Bg11-12]MBA6265462.1 hypothetical protein [Colwellia sp. Bg11-12]
MTNIAFNTDISSMIKTRYSIALATLPFTLMFSSFGVMWLISIWLELDTDTPLREFDNSLVWVIGFIGLMVILMIGFYLLGWLINALISSTVLGWDKDKVKNVYLRSQVPDNWLKGNQNLETAMANRIENWREKRESGMFFYILQTGVLSWGLIMYLVMAVVPALKSSDPLDLVSLLWQGGVWAIGGALFGYVGWLFSERQYSKYLSETPSFEIKNESEVTSLGQNTKLSSYIVLGAIGGVMISYWAMSGLLGATKSNTADILSDTAIQLNERLPMVIDEETTWIASSSHEDTFSYTYQLPNYKKENIDIEIFVDAMTPNIKTSVCNGESMKAFRYLKAVVIYDYLDNKQELVTQIKIDTKNCEQPE